jgi:DNA-binding XRE family transcriptional regulator
MSIERRQKAIWVAGGLALLAAMGVGLLGGMFVRLCPAQLPLGLVILGCAVLVGVALAASVPWWRRLDHMARDAHLTSWYWGGCFGGGVALMAAAAIDGVQGALELADRADASRQTINAIEADKYDPSLPLAFRLAALFDLPVERIFFNPFKADGGNSGRLAERLHRVLQQAGLIGLFSTTTSSKPLRGRAP